jgi:hypothetical protein
METSVKKKVATFAVWAAAGLAFVAGVINSSTTILDAVKNTWHMAFNLNSKPVPESVNLGLSDLTAKEINFFGGPSNLIVKFTVERTGQDDTSLSCYGEGYRDNTNMADSSQRFKSVKAGETNFISLAGSGKQSFTLLLAPDGATDLPTPAKLNFRINCTQQRSPWTPVEVTPQPPAGNPFDKR